MSADNWATCPRCMANARAEKARQEAEAVAAYGVKSVDEYLKLRELAETDIDLEPTLREDYEISIDDTGTFDVNYRAWCGI
jgi:hypothetical protein